MKLYEKLRLEQPGKQLFNTTRFKSWSDFESFKEEYKELELLRCEQTEILGGYELDDKQSIKQVIYLYYIVIPSYEKGIEDVSFKIVEIWAREFDSDDIIQFIKSYNRASELINPKRMLDNFFKDLIK